MGIKGLQYYTENHCPNVCKPVSLENMARDFKRAHHQLGLAQPVIVVDGMSVIHKLYAKKLDWIYGGRWRQFYAMWENFIMRFQQIGIKLVFFFDGSVVPLKRQEWIARRLKNMAEIDSMFQSIKITLREPAADFQLPVAMGTMSRFALKLLGVDVYTSVKEGDTEVAEYAQHNDAVMGILGQDTDYFIYDTKDYLSINHLDLDCMTTVLYDRNALATKLSLNVSELPLLSCLLGNDVVQLDMVKPFHRHLCSSSGERGTPITTLIVLVSNLIIRNRWRGNPNNIHELQAISQIVFGHPRNDALLGEGIKWYIMSSCPPANTSTDIVIKRHILVENLPTIYNLLHNLEYESSEVLEDCEETRLPPSALMFQSIRQRAYYVLFEGRTDVTIKEWLAYHGNQMLKQFMPTLVKPEPIKIDGGVPKIEVLWNESPQYQQVRLQCFVQCLRLSFEPHMLLSIPRQYVVLSCILNHMLVRRPNMLELWEVIAFVVQATHLAVITLEDLCNLPDEFMNIQAVHLSSLFMRGVTTVGMVLGICGYPFSLDDFMPWNFFDGKLFHNTYVNAKRTDFENLCKNKVDVEIVHKLLNLITSGTTLESRWKASQTA